MKQHTTFKSYCDALLTFKKVGMCYNMGQIKD